MIKDWARHYDNMFFCYRKRYHIPSSNTIHSPSYASHSDGTGEIERPIYPMDSDELKKMKRRKNISNQDMVMERSFIVKLSIKNFSQIIQMKKNTKKLSENQVKKAIKATETLIMRYPILYWA
uniref:Uncharacterized protein n=1 Tax=Rhabditophanes sp. KR3021 TaxID=114890 RepID=A0AC35U0V4_9BILA